jgi:hypothetical protein
MAKPITFNVQRLITAVAAEHRLLLKPDDAAFAIVTMNRLVLEESLEAIRAVVAEDLAQFKQTAQWAHSRAESAIQSEVRLSARALREELQSDIDTARLRATAMVQEVKEIYEKPLAYRDIIIMALTILLALLVGFAVGRLHNR